MYETLWLIEFLICFLGDHHNPDSSKCYPLSTLYTRSWSLDPAKFCVNISEHMPAWASSKSYYFADGLLVCTEVACKLLETNASTRQERA